MLSVFIFIQYVGILVLFAEIIYILQQNRSQMQGLLLTIATSTLVDFVGYLFELQATSKEMAMQAVKFNYIGKPFIAMASLWLILDCCKVKVSMRVKTIMGVLHTAISVLVLTSEQHKLFYTSVDFVDDIYFPHLVMGHSIIYNLYWVVMFVYLIIMLVVGIRSLRGATDDQEKTKIHIMLGIPITSLICIIAYISGVTRGYDCTVISYLIGSVLVIVLMIRFNLLDTVALAKEHAIDDLSQGMIVLDEKYELVYMNQQVMKFFPEIATENYKATLDKIEEYAKDKKRMFRGEEVYEIQDKDITEDDIYYGKMFVVTDITENHQYTIELEKQTAIAKEANKAKSDFLAKMSHEIRTPINAVLGMDEMILRESREDDVRKYARDIKSAANTLLELINDILDSSKIESGKLEIIPAEYHMDKMLKDISNMIKIKTEDKELYFHVEADETIPNKLFGDDVRIRQILINILNNAIKYTERGGVILRVSHTRKGDLACVRYEVEDTGIGIKKEDLPKLYEAFERIEEARNRNIEGTGLGMSIVVEMLHLMGSKLEVESRYGIGSTFAFEINQKVIGNETIGVLSLGEDEQDEYAVYNALFKAPDAKVLVVDDNDINRKVFRSLLKRTLVQIKDVDSGRKCLEWVQKEHYDMIFMDALMPQMDGIETLQNMKQLTNSKCKDVPVIILTADAVTGARERYLKKGFQDFLSKPVTGEDLENMVLKYLPEDKLLNEELLMDLEVEQSWEESVVELIRGQISEIDLDMGLCYCGDDSKFYVEVLMAFVEDGKQEELDECFREGRWEEYQLISHTIKGLMKTIGAMEMYEDALRLEQWTKDFEIDDVKQNHDFFIGQYNELLGKLRECMNQREK